MKKAKPLVIGNWKMNPATLARAEKLWLDVQKGLKGRRGIAEVAVAPPLPFITNLQELASTQAVDLVSQDVSAKEKGAHTGEVSGSMLRSIKVRSSIVGHSERRAAGETNESVNEKVKLLVGGKSTAIVCIGERQRDAMGDYFSFVEDQIRKVLDGLEDKDLKRVILAYEPIWAIGTGDNAEPADVQEMKLFIQKVLADIFERKAALSVRIIYGGSVTPENAEALLKDGDVDGFLVGGASLEAKRFVQIIKTADTYAKLV